MAQDKSLACVFDGEIPPFEQMARAEHGCVTWSAKFVGKCLGYNYKNFKGVLKRAQEILLSLDLEVTDHFMRERTISSSGKAEDDIRMTRFACLLAVTRADSKKIEVARALAHLVRYSEECQIYLDDPEPLDRTHTRHEISKHERGLCRTAQFAGIEDFARFRNANYRGLYNMDLSDLKLLRGTPDDRTPLDFMGPTELAANLFSLTQTDAKIKNENVKGQEALEKTAEGVGRTVRETMEKISGQRPEDLPVHEDIRIVRKKLKKAGAVLKLASCSDVKELPPAGPFLEAPAED